MEMEIIDRKKSKNMKKIYIFLLILFLFVVITGYAIVSRPDETPIDNNDSINSFEECIAAGYPAMESYPRQCKTSDGKSFTEYIGNELEKIDLIRIDSPRPNQEIESPLIIEGEARGYWFFEGDFPVVLTDWDGLIIAQGIAQAKGEWMTEDFVQFEARLEFEKPEYSNKGTLILRKDNPSGLPENDDALEVPVIFKENNNIVTPSNNMIVIMQTNLGEIKIELFSSDAPKTVENFVKLAKSGFYDNVKFHRVIKGFMIQSGDPLTKDDSLKNKWGTGGPGYAFEDEIHSNNHNVAGTISMANAGSDTNGSQFFINTVDNNYLDSKHTVFGKVIEGMDVVRSIENTATEGPNRPIDDVIIESIKIAD